ncbi:MAG: HAD family phosphatase [Actinobacteria bacterium]|jgi:HAD superfamily hydrolase (TIGR01509 family)|nr:HAD family phosphatase [Actinomycetota bacterium]
MSAILFDMDGTLIDSEPLWLESEIEVMAEVGCHWDQQDQINCLGGPAERTEQYMQDRSKNIKPYGYFLKQLHSVMKEKMKTHLTLIPNATELVKSCKRANIKTALVTASSRDLMLSALNRFPIGSFDVTVSRDDVKNSKPDPAPYLLAARLLGVDISKCLVFEDSLTGVESGLRAGAQVIAIPHLIKIEEQAGLRVISSLSEINLDQLFIWYPFLGEGF